MILKNFLNLNIAEQVEDSKYEFGNSQSSVYKIELEFDCLR